MPWITPITDRTLNDVQYAFSNQNEVSDLKGAWNPSDINRVINNVEYVKTLLNSYGYYPSITSMPTFTESDLPYITSVMNVLRTNVSNIVTSFYQLNNPNIGFGSTFDYVDANSLEINLSITNQLLENMIALFKYSGTFYSGEDLIL